MKRCKGLFLFACIYSYLLVSVVTAADLDFSTRKAIDSAIVAEMEKQEAVGLAIGIIKDGEVVYTQGYGYADLSKKRKVNNSTLFRWASVAKPMTAVAAMQLVEAGKLDLDEDIRTLVPEYPDKGEVITMRQILGHLGGMPHYQDGIITSEVEYKQRHPFEDVVVALDKFKETPLVSTPGTSFHYSTHGYILASAVIQRAGEEQFARQVEKRIAKPLKMHSLEPDYQWKSRSERAKGYKKVNGEIVESTNTDVSWKLGAGGWMSNIGDLAKFAAGLMGDELVSQESKNIMWEQQKDADGIGTGYGLGFGVSMQNNALKVSHNGSQEKTRTRMAIYPAVDPHFVPGNHGVVIMSNSEYANQGAFSTLIYSTLNSLKASMAIPESTLKQVQSPPPDNIIEQFNLDSFYRKCLLVEGLPIVTSNEVRDEALMEAEYLIRQMIGHRPELLRAMALRGTRFTIMSPNEFTTDVPEHSDLEPKGYWDKRARGLGATRERPSVSCGEENLLCLPGDPYSTENILIHEFAHAIHEMGLVTVDSTFDKRLEEIFNSAMENGLYKGKYASTNRMEYWAESAQSWFDTNRENDDQHNHVDTREEIKEYDPRMATLLEEIFTDTSWRYIRPEHRGEAAHFTNMIPDARHFEWPIEIIEGYKLATQQDQESD